MKYINKILLAIFCGGIVFSCVDKYDCQVEVDKPLNAALNEHLSQFDLLKSYVDHSGSPFQLAVRMSEKELQKKDFVFSTLLANFDAVDINGIYNPINALADDGTYNFSGMQNLVNITANAGLTLYGGSLCSNQEQRAAYYNQLIAPIDIPVATEKGTTKLFDFEDDEIGKTYPMTGNSSAVVEADPANESGKVLHVGTDDIKANDSYAKLHVTLPTGRVLGDYVRLNIDLRHVGSDGIWGQGMHLLINDSKYSLGTNADDLKASGNRWARSIVIKLNETGGVGSPGFEMPERLKTLTEFDLSVGAKSGGAQYFLDNISMDYEVAGKGSTIIDFEKDAIGTTYPMTSDNSGTATVKEDPDGESGHTLYIDHAAYAFPKFKVKLKEGLTLGNYTGMMMDMRLKSGQWGQGMRVVIEGEVIDLRKNANDYGNREDEKWTRGVEYVKFVRQGTYTALGQEVPAGTIEIPDKIRNSNEFEFSIGSNSSNWTAYIDNLCFIWETEAQHIEKTPEEKKEILTFEMDKWIGGMVYAGVNEVKSVKAWNIVSNPLDKKVDENTFNWEEYLGKNDYVRTAVKIARDTVKNVNVELELFVSNVFYQYNDMGKMADDLISLVGAWEADGVTKIDGYNISLNAVCSQNIDSQKGNKENIVMLFDKLAKTGKLVRVSDLSMMFEDANGNYVATSLLTEEERASAASYMAFIIQEYRKIIPKDKQYGISFSGMAESKDGYQICPWTSDYNRNELYEGIVEGLSEIN